MHLQLLHLLLFLNLRAVLSHSHSQDRLQQNGHDHAGNPGSSSGIALADPAERRELILRLMDKIERRDDLQVVKHGEGRGIGERAASSTTVLASNATATASNSTAPQNFTSSTTSPLTRTVKVNVVNTKTTSTSKTSTTLTTKITSTDHTASSTKLATTPSLSTAKSSTNITSSAKVQVATAKSTHLSSSSALLLKNGSTTTTHRETAKVVAATATTSTTRKTLSSSALSSRTSSIPTAATFSLPKASSTIVVKPAAASASASPISPYANSLPCTPAPSTFSPSTIDNFSTICTIRYCPATPVANMVWSSPPNTTFVSPSAPGTNPAVTRQEVETALGMLSLIPLVNETGTTGNILADGVFGQGAYDAGLLLELTGDVRALDIVLRMADNILALRNNPETGRIMWTGNREAIWPTTPAPPLNSTPLAYAGCEQGDILGHMVNAAVYILKTPCLWSMTPPEFQGPTVFQANDTYLTRALALVDAGDFTVQSYFLPWFLTSNSSFIQPNDTRWNQVGDSGNHPGAPMPWNRRMLMMHGLHRLAAAHETMPAYNPTLTWRYDQIIQVNIAEFMTDLKRTKSVVGSSTFNWNYVHFESSTEEVEGVHGYFDIWGMWMAWQRNEKLFNVTNSTGTSFANTFEDTINLRNDTFSGLVDGISLPGAESVPGLSGGWSFYAMWRPEWLTTIVKANIASGFNSRTPLAIPLLWTKHAMNIQSDEFWTGYASSGTGTIPGATSTTVTLRQLMEVKMAKREFQSNLNTSAVTTAKGAKATAKKVKGSKRWIERWLSLAST